MTIAVFFDPHGRRGEFEALKPMFPQVDLRCPADGAELAQALPGAEILIVTNRVYTPDNAAIIRECGTSLRWLAFLTSGIDKAQASGLPSGCVVTNVAGLRAFAVSEHAFSLMLGLVRRVRQTEAARAQAFWTRDRTTPLLDNLAGKHLVIVGTGAIGQDIAKKAKAFDMRVTGVSRSTAALANFDALRARAELAAAAAEADILMVAAMYDESTHHMISRDVIGAMRKSAFLVNIARGLLVDETALVEALEAGRIAGVGLDVMEEEPLPASSPLWRHDNALVTPHIAGAGGEGRGATHASMFADNLKLWLAGKPLEKVVIART
jgi:phosphoglycerate dehydrogenase-like enzyme